jgi:hypothetical protein
LHQCHGLWTILAMIMLNWNRKIYWNQINFCFRAHKILVFMKLN